MQVQGGEYELVLCKNPQWCVVFKPSTGTYLDLWLRRDTFVDMVGKVSPMSPVQCQVELGRYKNGVFHDSVVCVGDWEGKRGRPEQYGREGYYKKSKN